MSCRPGSVPAQDSIVASNQAAGPRNARPHAVSEQIIYACLGVAEGRRKSGRKGIRDSGAYRMSQRIQVVVADRVSELNWGPS